MTAKELTSAKKELMKLQKQLSNEMGRGKYKDIAKINALKKEIKSQKIEIGNITRGMISQIAVEK